MDKQTADKIITEYTRKLFGFALSKMQSISQAEELASEIILEAYVTLLKRENISNINGYIYRIAGNVYANFIDKTKKGAHQSLDEVSIPTDDNFTEAIAESETYKQLCLEIAYLSKIQREIVVLHYFENKKIDEISKALSLPNGTVKWHLFESKKNLKEGMNAMRKAGTLGINPISFSNMGHCGCAGKLGDTNEFLQKRLTQNIAYAAYWSPKTINQMAEELNVSPLFVEDEVTILEEYGFMDKISGGKYLTNIYITENSIETIEAENVIFNKYAKILCEKYVPILINYLQNIDKSKIYIPDNDFNLLLWSVITFACDYKLIVDKGNSSDQYSVKRKDGGDYIAFATISKECKTSFDSNKYNACGNMTRGSMKGYPMSAWQLNTYYDGREGDWRNCLSKDFDYIYEFVCGMLKKEESQIEKYGSEDYLV